MAYSSYQVQRLIERLRRMGRWIGWPRLPGRPPADPVTTRPEARAASPAPASNGATRSAAPPRVGEVRAEEQHDPRVEVERERRAGSFMQPPYVPHLPPPIPKVPRKPRKEPRTRPLTDG